MLMLMFAKHWAFANLLEVSCSALVVMFTYSRRGPAEAHERAHVMVQLPLG